MTRYGVRDLHGLLVWIDHRIRTTRTQEASRVGDLARLTKEEYDNLFNMVMCVNKHFKALELTDASPILNDFPSPDVTLGECRGRLSDIKHALTAAMERRAFMYVPTSVQMYAPLINLQKLDRTIHDRHGKSFGEAVFVAFPDARFDAQQFALCMVAGADTAAIFHLMRVIEVGVRKLGAHLGVRRVRDYVKSGTRYKLKPIEHCTWECACPLS